MIERIIENWLIKSSERTYQVPFCFLLQQEGKTVIHLTRHTAMEHGKDVIAIDNDGQPHAYQLKGVSGKHFTLSDWQNIINQIFQLVLTPITHPSVQSQQYHKSYLVINGDMNEEVQHAIYAWNQQHEKNGFPQYRLEVIVKGQILKMALKQKDYLIPSELVDIKNLLELYLYNGKEFLDKAKFSHLLNSVLNNMPPKSNNESSRLASSTALLCSLAISSYADEDNHLAIIEAWVIYIFSILRHCELYERDLKQYKNEVDLAKKIITNALLNLYAECKQNPELIQGNPLLDAFVLKHRKTILLGVISFLGIVSDEINFEEIDEFISSQIDNVIVWGESAIPYFLSMYFFYKKVGKHQLANEILAKTFSDAINGIINLDVSFSDIYSSAEDTINRSFSNTTNESNFSPRISRIIEPIIALMSKPEFYGVVKKNWPEVSRCIFKELSIYNSYDFYLWRADNAQIINKHPEMPQSWQALLDQAKIYETKKIPLGIQALKDYVPLFLIVFPHRLDVDIIKWYSQS